MTSGIVKAFLLYVLLHQEALICIFPSGTIVRPVINVTPVLLPFLSKCLFWGEQIFVFSRITCLKNTK